MRLVSRSHPLPELRSRQLGVHAKLHPTGGTLHRLQARFPDADGNPPICAKKGGVERSLVEQAQWCSEEVKRFNSAAVETINLDVTALEHFAESMAVANLVDCFAELRQVASSSFQSAWSG